MGWIFILIYADKINMYTVNSLKSLEYYIARQRHIFKVIVPELGSRRGPHPKEPFCVCIT